MDALVIQTYDANLLDMPRKIEVVGKCNKCGGDVRKISYTSGKESFICIDCEAQKKIQDSVERLERNTRKPINYNIKHCGLNQKEYEGINKPYKTSKGNIEAYNLSIEYANSFNNNTSIGLYIYGDAETGKTFLARKILKILINGCYSVYYSNFNKLVSSLKKEKSRFENTTIRTCLDADMLIIDNIQQKDNFSNSDMQAIIEYRYKNKKPIIFVSRLKPNEFIQKGDQCKEINLLMQFSTRCLELRK
ncbi:MAG: ATP-binding protein [Erysipelotrichaceae bacterium]|nr:ATP-binding protein [Erysipelotrichaceae bacterium]